MKYPKKEYLKYIGITLTIMASAIIWSGCGDQYAHWKIDHIVDLGESGPIGITASNGHIWISDGNNNLLNKYDSDFNLVSTVDSFERPMHIAESNGKVYVPEYGSDNIVVVDEAIRSILNMGMQLNAPAGIDVQNGKIAIADFYSNSIFLITDGSIAQIGEKGAGDLEFHYPTDVQIFNDTLFVADAYNHRIQIIGPDGKHINSIGEAQEMNATTGLYVTSDAIFTTDLENDRVLIFNRKGEVLDEIVEGFDKPTDLMVWGDRLYVLNYGSGEVVVLTQGK